LSLKQISLSEVCSIKHGYAFKGEYFSDSITKDILLTPGNFKIGGGFKKDKLKYYDGPINKEYILKPYDLIVTMTDLSKKGDTLGFSALVPNDDNIYLHNQRIGLIENVNEEIIDKNYLYWLLRDAKYHHYIVSSATGTTVKHTSPKTILKYEFEVPPLEEQRFISEILSNIELKSMLNEKINKNLEGLVKSIYRYHFIDFKPYSQDNFKSTTIGEIPENWSVQSIEDFVDDMKNGGTPKRGESDYWENGTVPWLKTGEINNNIIIKSEEHITKLGLKNSSAKLLPVNSIIMALYGTGTAARIGLLKLEATTNQACCAMICNDFNKTLFLYLFLLFNQKEIENLASGSVQQNLSKDLIANLKLVVPPIEIIDNLPFKEIFDTIANNYFEIEYLTNLRDTLLPKLMSGEIDVSKINCDLIIVNNHSSNSIFSTTSSPLSVNLYSLPFLTSGLIHSTSS